MVARVLSNIKEFHYSLMIQKIYWCKCMVWNDLSSISQRESLHYNDKRDRPDSLVPSQVHFYHSTKYKSCICPHGSNLEFFQNNQWNRFLPMVSLTLTRINPRITKYHCPKKLHKTWKNQCQQFVYKHSDYKIDKRRSWICSSLKCNKGDKQTPPSREGKALHSLKFNTWKTNWIVHVFSTWSNL